VVQIHVTFHYSLLLVTSAVASRYLVFVTLIVTQALRAQRGSRVAAAIIPWLYSFPTQSAPHPPSTGATRNCREWQIHSSTDGPENCTVTNSKSFIYRTL